MARAQAWGGGKGVAWFDLVGGIRIGHEEGRGRPQLELKELAMVEVDRSGASSTGGNRADGQHVELHRGH